MTCYDKDHSDIPGGGEPRSVHRSNGRDKRLAVRERYRISEKTLILLALFGGSIGSLAAMHLFHHKTRKKKFAWGVPAILALQAALCIYLIIRASGV